MLKKESLTRFIIRKKLFTDEKNVFSHRKDMSHLFMCTTMYKYKY